MNYQKTKVLYILGESAKIQVVMGLMTSRNVTFKATFRLYVVNVTKAL